MWIWLHFLFSLVTVAISANEPPGSNNPPQAVVTAATEKCQAWLKWDRDAFALEMRGLAAEMDRLVDVTEWDVKSVRDPLMRSRAEIDLALPLVREWLAESKQVDVIAHRAELKRAHNLKNNFGFLLNSILAIEALIPERGKVRPSPLVCAQARQVSRLATLVARIAVRSHSEIILEALTVVSLARDIDTIARALFPEAVKVELSDLQPFMGDFFPADEGLVVEAIGNFLVNSRDAMIGRHPASFTVAVRRVQLKAGEVVDAEAVVPVRCKKDGEYVAFVLTDTGIGMATEQLVRSFLGGETTKTDGHGIGLEHTMEVLRGHGAAVEVTSAAGVGTTVTVFFPVVRGSKHGPATTVGDEIGVPDGEPEVFVVDDNFDSAKSLAVLLALTTKRGLRVAVSGTQVTPLLKRGQKQFAVLDVGIPGEEVSQTIATWMAINPDLHIVINSGYSRDTVPTLRDCPHIKAWLAKPVDFNGVAVMITNFLGALPK